MSKRMHKKGKSSDIKECQLFVDGMHCSSCELLIEKKLLRYKNIETADASLNRNRVVIFYKNSSKPDVEELNKDFASIGYAFSETKIKKNRTPLLQFKNGQVVMNPERTGEALRIGLVIISLIVAFIVFDRLQLGQYISVSESSSLPAFFLLGLVAGLSSCAALVGGLLLSMIKQWNELYIDADSNTQKATPHILFHVGRLISFAILGGVLGLIGSAISLTDSTIFSILTIVVSLVMLLLALQMLDIKWAQNFRFTSPKFVTRYASNEKNFEGKFMPGIIGALTFFLPCGFTLIAQTIALTSGSFITGSLIMLLFALGTLPILIGISLSGLTFNRKPHLTAKFNTIAGLVIVFFVIFNINGQLNVLGLPSLSDISLPTQTSDQPEGVVEVVDGQQTISFVAKGFDYTPTSSTTLKSGIPTVMTVDNQGIQSCGVFMVAEGLFPGIVELKKGDNQLEFTPQKGTYKLTCSMGMVPPVTITVL